MKKIDIKQKLDYNMNFTLVFLLFKSIIFILFF